MVNPFLFSQHEIYFGLPFRRPTLICPSGVPRAIPYFILFPFSEINHLI